MSTSPNIYHYTQKAVANSLNYLPFVKNFLKHFTSEVKKPWLEPKATEAIIRNQTLGCRLDFAKEEL